ncbi:phage tail tape measure protein [Pseudomonas sp. Leaf127]|uniref:phage tail tape measure protein n=1 Tax=Pseudomonas sp. Leaf127 TaxID=1736267 RepID=UPI0009E9854A|nr:phage tail tape measure protein [Pseudomonas sp. Leaf127]
MAKMALALVIGGAVASSLGSAFNAVEGRIQKLEAKGSKAKVLKNIIGETMKLRDEWKRAHDSGVASADGLLRKLDTNLDSLRKQGVQVGKLGQEYRRLGQEAKSADLQLKGHQQVQAGKESMRSNIGQAVAGAGMVAVPTKISGDYQAVIRDIAIKAGMAGKPEEAQMAQTVVQTSRDTGMARNDVADLVNQLVGTGMDVKKALEYAPVAAKFSIGQGTDGTTTAKMISALGQNAQITDPKMMEQALEAIAFQGQAGSFEAADMAKWFPELLSNMAGMKITGMDAVTQLGAILQVQMKSAGSSDEAANNLKNWMGKIGASDTVDAYKKVGIDYEKSMQTGLQNKKSTLESSFALAQEYVQKTDPKKDKQMAEAMAKINKETDPAKARAQIEALNDSLKTGNIFADMQVKAALQAYTQNKALYEELKSSAGNSKGILDKNLSERRETSNQRWAETGQALNDSMRSIGDAIRPITDQVAQGITKVAQEFTRLSDGSQSVIAGAVAIGAAFVGLKTAFSAFTIGKGLLNIARGKVGGLGAGDPNKVQKVFVTNADDDKGDGKGAGKAAGKAAGKDGDDDKKGGKRAKVLGLLALGLGAFGKKAAAADADDDAGADKDDGDSASGKDTPGTAAQGDKEDKDGKGKADKQDPPDVRGKLLDLLDTGVKTIRKKGAGEGEAAEGAEAPEEGMRGKVLGLVETGIKTLRMGGPGAAEGDAEAEGGDGEDEAPGGLVGTGLKLLDIFQNASNDDEGGDDGGDGEGGAVELQKVFVVNASEIGGPGAAGGGAQADAGGRRGRGRRGRGGRGRRGGNDDGGEGGHGARSGSRPGARPPVPPVPPIPPAPPPAPEIGRIGRMMGAVGKVGDLAKRLPGGSLVDAGMSAVNVAMTAETNDEKAEGYGAAAGSLAGTLAGAAAGAAIGSVVPVIGTAVGGAVGAMLGSMGGEFGGSWLGKTLFGDDAPADETKDKDGGEAKEDESSVGKWLGDLFGSAPEQPEPVPPPAPALGDAVRPPVAVEPAAPIKPVVQAPPLVLGDALRVTVPPVPEVKPPALGDAVRPPVPLMMSSEAVRELAKAMPPPVPAPGDALRVTAPPKPEVKPPALGDAVRAPAPVEVPAKSADRTPAITPGDVVRELAKAAPPPPPAQEMAKAAAPPVAAGAKVDQSFTFSPNMPVRVDGDVKDPAQLARDLLPHLQRHWEAFQREVASRQASTQLYDQPHV